MSDRPARMTSGDEFLDAILTQAEHTNTLLAAILDRLPDDTPVVVGEPGRVELREPQPAPARRNKATRRGN